MASYTVSDRIISIRRLIPHKADFTHFCVLPGFKWGDLPPKSVVVDVGGGLGHVTMRIARKYPNLRYIVQDRLAIIEQAKEV